MSRLCLSRKPGQRVFIGDDIVVTVREGYRVKIMIEAPDDVPIFREEVLNGGRDQAADDKTGR